MKKNYLITGITGFAGAHLAQLLFDKGHNVFGLIRGSNGMETDILDTVTGACLNNIIFLYGDLNDYKSLEKVFDTGFHNDAIKFDGCFHLAAQSHPPTSLVHPVNTMKINVMGTVNLIDVIERYQPKCKLMFCSTSEVYGNAGKEGGLLLETDKLTPSNPYAVSKAAIDLYMQERMENKKIIGFITRAFSHTGIRRGKNFSISADAYQIAQIIKKKMVVGGDLYPVPEIEVGNLETVRVVIDVKDVVNAYYLLMQNPDSNGKIFNVCGDVPRKMEYFTNCLIKLSGIEIAKLVSPKYYRPIDILYQHGCTKALKELTGWEPKIAIETTLKSLLEYWVKKIN